MHANFYHYVDFFIVLGQNLKEAKVFLGWVIALSRVGTDVEDLENLELSGNSEKPKNVRE